MLLQQSKRSIIGYIRNIGGVEFFTNIFHEYGADRVNMTTRIRSKTLPCKF